MVISTSEVQENGKWNDMETDYCFIFIFDPSLVHDILPLLAKYTFVFVLSNMSSILPEGGFSSEQVIIAYFAFTAFRNSSLFLSYTPW